MKMKVSFVDEGANLKVDFNQVETLSKVTDDYHVLRNKPTINSVTLDGDISLKALGLRGIYYDTKANWDSQADLVSEEGVIYIYSDAQTIYDDAGNPTYLAGIKIGDGGAYLIDLPFLSNSEEAVLINHIADEDAHTSAAEKEAWNNKVSAYMDEEEPENLVLSKTNYI